MHLLIEPAAHGLVNVGDIAMLQVTYRRLREQWPSARIGVITADPQRLHQFCPGAVPIPASGRDLWLEEPYLGFRLERQLPATLANRSRAFESNLRRRHPQRARSLIRLRRRLRGRDIADLERFLAWLGEAAMVLVSGAGLIADPYAPRAISTLELLELAKRGGAVTAMLGQGIGPLTEPRLTELSARILPSLDLIALREDRTGGPLLDSLSVRRDRIIVTGDDAIELAMGGERGMRDAIGINVRVARYAGVMGRHLETIGRVVNEMASRCDARVVPVPISHYRKERDAEAISELIGFDGPPGRDLRRPEGVLRQIENCRLVVTGSYHGAVFALARGIPAIGLIASDYYAAKFEGLSKQFGSGCTYLRLGGPRLGERLEAAISETWEGAPALAPQLISSATRQVERGREAHRRLGRILAEARE